MEAAATTSTEFRPAVQARPSTDELLARFAAGEGTREDVGHLIFNLRGSEMIQIQVPRATRPTPGGTVKLFTRTGPSSDADRKVSKVEGESRIWAAWWRVADLKAWFASTRFAASRQNLHG